METEAKKPNKSGSKFFIILSLCFFLLSCALAWQLYSQKNKTEIITIEKEKVSNEYDSVKSELSEVQQAYEGLQTNNKELQAELDGKKAELADLQVQLEKYKGDAYMIVKLKKELKTIRDLIKSYLHEIDALNQKNQALTAENEKVKSDLGAEKTKVEELSTEKQKLHETVELGSKLKAIQIKIEAIKVKGSSKESLVTKAKRAEKIKTCFVVGENPIAKKENKTVFLKITGPDGRVLANNENEDTFVVNGEKLNFSAKKEMKYENKDTDMCMYFTKKDEFMPGKYKVEIFSDGGMMGSGNIELK